MKVKRSVIAMLCAAVIFAAFSTMVIGQSKLTDERSVPLVGVWEKHVPAFSDCNTGEPFPDTPYFYVLETFNQDGTMTEENTDPNDGPYRTTGHGVWQRINGRQFQTSFMHYSFAPNKTHTYTIKVRSTITLSLDMKSYAEMGTFDVLDAQNNNEIVFSGCFNDGYRASRISM